MTVTKPYIGSVGIRVRTYLRADLTNVQTAIYYWRKPVASDPTTVEEVTHDCGIEDYALGVVYYDIIGTDFDVAGEYKHQVKVVYANGDTYRSHTRSFSVLNYYE